MNLGKPNPHRKLLNRLLFSEDIRRDIFTLDERTASRFVEGLQQHESPMDPLFMIRRHKDKSMVRSIFTIGSSSSFMDRVVVPFLGWLGQDALSKGTCKQCQQAIVNDLARAPGLLEALLDALRSDEISDEAALLWFIERLLLDDDQDGVEARKSELHVDLVKRLAYSRTPSVKAQAMVLVNGILDPAAGGKSSDGAGESVATMTTLTLGGDSSNGRSVDAIREALPGGRHSNDHADFRSIGIVPTVDEIMCNTIPFLPTPADAQYPHLERQFRLLRHDMVASVIEAVTALASMKKRGSEDDGGKDKITGGGGGGRSGPRTLILPGAKRGSVVVGDRDRSVSVIVHFDWPRDHPLSRMGSGKKRIEYLQPAKGGGGGRVGG
ncbi:unnamed protein product, partial [Sphacelaria rigidula]